MAGTNSNMQSQEDNLVSVLVHGIEEVLPEADVQRVLGVQRNTLQKLRRTHAQLLDQNEKMEETIKAMRDALKSKSSDLRGIRLNVDHAHATLRSLERVTGVESGRQ